ncbi:MFS transporter [Aquibaculum sediminis]|uniref:MFS transporter n=1 Tax=Aquibaculum sediminis TaxID=3231907 RepID=UPI0034547128
MTSEEVGQRPAHRPSVPSWLPWLIWSLGALFFCYGFFQRMAPSVIIDPLMRDFAVGAAVLGNLSAIYFYAYAGLQIPVGLLADAWGPRRLLTAGALCCGAGSLLFALAPDLNIAYLGRLLVGVGAAASFVGTLKLATNWFPASRFAQLTGMTMAAGMLGGVGGQVPLAAAVEWFGWRSTLAAAAAGGLILAVLLWTIVRDRKPDAPAPRFTGGAAPRGGLRLVLRMPQQWLLAFLGGAMTAPMLAFAGLWGVAWLMQIHGMTRPEAASHTSLLLIGWAIGSPLAGALADRIGRRLPILRAGALIGLCCLMLLLYVPGLPSPIFLALFLIAGIGLSATAVTFAVAREITPTHAVGAAYGLLNGAVVGGGALFQPLLGLLLDLQWDGRMVEGAPIYSARAFDLAFLSLAVFLLLALLASLLLSETRGKR